MGGTDSTTEHHYHTIQYRTDPETIKMLEHYRQQVTQMTKLISSLQESYERALAQGKRLQDPNKYQELKEQAFMAFLQNVNKLKFTEPIPRKDGHKYHVLIGNISSGKSSLINMACNLNLAVGLGQCTQECKQVAISQSGKVHIYDCPGINQNFSVFDPQVLSYFHTADRIFILFPDSLKNCKQICLVMGKIKPNNTYIVRTKCDEWSTIHTKTIQQQTQTDKALLKKWGLSLPVLATSSKKDKNFRDNQLFIDLLKGNR